MRKIDTVVVYLGSCTGNGSEYMELAYELGGALAKRNITVVYGGANVGTMKALANGALASNGKVIGVFPKGFQGRRENAEKNIDIMHSGLSELIIAENMSDRKATMEKLSDAAIILPGSFGTLDELFEYVLHLQLGSKLGYHDKPIYVLNHNGFYDPIATLIDNMVSNGFLKDDDKSLVSFYPTITEMLEDI